ncbi:bcl-2 homologous antagonist/killer-like [Leucoraja erinacea]|uniref:bcl-2 homologous antagonist/killer-like n=1 Tax=Leucoraja erinaceus TaxID=7782 RepID=UPI002455946F|nr:bcl-2 homologous antagonist/killer-like [Leucoraja erinacea]
MLDAQPSPGDLVLIGRRWRRPLSPSLGEQPAVCAGAAAAAAAGAGGARDGVTLLAAVATPTEESKRSEGALRNYFIMASGNSGDSCRSCSAREEKNSETDAELSEVDGVEESLRDDVYNRYRSEGHEDVNTGVATVVDPLQICASSSVEIGHQLAIIGDELNHQKNRQFQDAGIYLPLAFQCGCKSIRRAAERLFDNDINWRQTITLLSFGYKTARYFYRRGLMEPFGRVTEHVAKIPAKNQITRWVAECGGWTTALTLENATLKWLLGILVVAMLAVAIAHRIYQL